MSDEQENEGAGGAENGQAGTEQQPANQEQQGQEGAEQLGDAGKKALDTMKAERKAARDAERAAVNSLAELHDKTAAEIRAAIKDGTLADLIGKPAAQAAGNGEPPVDVAKVTAAAKREATAAANQRILRAEVRAAAAGKLADPADALTMLDLSGIEVGDDGEVDRSELDDAIAELLTRKPYLAAGATTTTFGKSDGGVRGPSKGPTLDERIAEAEKNRDFTTARQLKLQKLAAANR